jgi:hypothetical protein
MNIGVSEVVHVARAIRVAQRGAGAGGAAGALRVLDVAPVVIPDWPPMDARTSQGDVWRRLWSLPDRLILEFVDVVRADVGDDGSIVFDRALEPDVEQHLLLDHLLPLVLARRGVVVLHGAVVSLDDRAAVLLGPSGIGKSTLTAFVGQHGWTVGGDDGAVLDIRGARVTVEPTYTTIRLTPDASELLGVSPYDGVEVAGKLRVRPRGVKALSQSEMPLVLIAVLQPSPGNESASFTTLRGAEAHAALFGSTFHADLGDGRLLRNVMDELGRVVESTVVGRLRVPRGRPGLLAAEGTLRELVAE